MFYTNGAHWDNVDDQKGHILRYWVGFGVNGRINSSLEVENELYLHCTGRDGNIAKYTIKNFMVEKESIKLNYENISSIYEYNVNVDKVDERYIHITDPSSNKKAICNLITLICEYQ